MSETKSMINYRILILIIVGTIIFQFILMTIGESVLSDNLVFAIAMINPLAASIASWIIAKRYGRSIVFGKSYFFLGVAYFSVFLAELTYYIYESVLGLEPYPSIADIFFFLLYPFALMHIILNIRFFNAKLDVPTKIWLILVPIIITLVYALFSSELLIDDEFYYYFGLIFVIGSSITMAFAAVGAKIFRQGTLGIAWLVLVLGILANTIGDVWYYYLEVSGEYSLAHPVNLFWYGSYWIIVYALWKHKETL